MSVETRSNSSSGLYNIGSEQCFRTWDEMKYLSPDQEWDLENRICEAFIDENVPEYFRDLLHELWAVYCELSPNP